MNKYKLDELNDYYTEHDLDPLDQYVLRLFPSLSIIISGIIKIVGIIFLWILSIIILSKFLKPESTWSYFLVICLCGVPPLFVSLLWEKYVSRSKKSREINEETQSK